jgi:hypothetical protein
VKRTELNEFKGTVVNVANEIANGYDYDADFGITIIVDGDVVELAPEEETYDALIDLLNMSDGIEEGDTDTLEQQALDIQEAMDVAVTRWQELDDPIGNEDGIEILIEGKLYPLSFFAADMFQIFGSFIDEVIEVAQENQW